jgi:hypothetical protein
VATTYDSMSNRSLLILLFLLTKHLSRINELTEAYKLARRVDRYCFLFFLYIKK